MFIGRRLDGSIYGTWTSKQPDDADHIGMDEVEDTHPDVLAFQNQPQRVVIDPAMKIAALEARIVALENK